MKIVVGVDGSKTAESAAQTAAQWANFIGADLHVVSAYKRDKIESFDGGTQEILISTEAQALAAAEQTAENLSSSLATLSITPVAIKGNPAAVLVQYARERDAKLIVVGNKRVQGPSRVLGSVARDVAQQAHCDVYIAHTQGS